MVPLTFTTNATSTNGWFTSSSITANVFWDQQPLMVAKETDRQRIERILSRSNFADERRQILKEFGRGILEHLDHKILDLKDQDLLVRIELDGSLLMRRRTLVYLLVKDPSTGEDYLIRVPSNMTRLRQALAWTFGLEEAEYEPVLQT